MRLRQASHSVLYALIFSLLSACASLGIEAPKTLNERIAYVETSADSVVIATTNALNAHTISSKDAQFVSDSAKQLQLLVSAVGNDPDPKSAQGRLKLAEGILVQIQGYVAAHEVKK